MTGLLQDVRYALRQMRRAPGFTAVALITLALGIGATTAMFTVVNAVLLRPLPYRDPQRLLALGEYDTRNGIHGNSLGSVAYPNVVDVRTRNRVFEDIAAYDSQTGTLIGTGEPLHVNFAHISAGTFRLLGARPFMGRDFRPEEDQPGHYVAAISYSLWRTRLNSDSAIVGRSLNLNGRSYEVVAVMPAGFQFPIAAEGRDLWLTFSRPAESDAPGDNPVISQRGNHSYSAIARLKQGVSLQQANADLSTIAKTLATEYPGTNAFSGIAVTSEVDYLVGDTRNTLIMLLSAVGLVLLIACANVANLLLVRGGARTREIGLRGILGAKRLRIVRQLITEASVLSLCGSALGAVFAFAMLQAVLSFYPENLPRADQIGMDYRVLLFSAMLTIFTGILFGIVPALRISTPNLAESLRGGSRVTSGQAASRLRSALVVVEIALGVMLLVGAGLLLRSLNRLTHVDLGFRPDHLLTASFDLSETRYDADQGDRFIHDLIERVKQLRGVTAASGAMPLPLDASNWSISFNWPDHPVPDEDEPSAGVYVVTPGFFETMKIPLLRGRTFDDRDQRNSAPVMIVTQAFSRKFFPGQDAIGRRIKIDAGEGPKRESYKLREIVGVVGDIRTSDLGKEPAAAYYVPLPQLVWGAPTLVVRTAGIPSAEGDEIRKVLSSMDSDAPLYAIRTMDDYLALDLGRARFQAVLLGLFAGLALVLTAVGLYGVMAQTVVQRTHEIGLRIALGASRQSMLSMVLRHSTMLTVVGTVLGLAGALSLAKLIESLLYQTPPRDPLTYSVVCVVLALTAILASCIPAVRATRIEPTEALRYE